MVIQKHDRRFTDRVHSHHMQLCANFMPLEAIMKLQARYTFDLDWTSAIWLSKWVSAGAAVRGALMTLHIYCNVHGPLGAGEASTLNGTAFAACT